MFPARSVNSNRNVSFQVNVCHDIPPLVVIIISSDQLKVAITSPLVRAHDVGLYVIVPLGKILSILLIVTV